MGVHTNTMAQKREHDRDGTDSDAEGLIVDVAVITIQVPRPGRTCFVCGRDVVPCEKYLEVYNCLTDRKESIHFVQCSQILWEQGHLDERFNIAYGASRRVG